MPPFDSSMGRWCLTSRYEHDFTKRNVQESWHSAHSSGEHGKVQFWSWIVHYLNRVVVPLSSTRRLASRRCRCYYNCTESHSRINTRMIFPCRNLPCMPVPYPSTCILYKSSDRTDYCRSGDSSLKKWIHRAHILLMYAICGYICGYVFDSGLNVFCAIISGWSTLSSYIRVHGKCIYTSKPFRASETWISES